MRQQTRRETFLLEMGQVILWRDLCKVIKPFYPKVKRKGAGRPPVGLERMLRIHFLQHWFNLSDPAVEEALYDSRAMRNFVGIDLGREPAANVHDSPLLGDLLHGDETRVWGDSAYSRPARYHRRTRAACQRLYQQERRSQSAVERPRQIEESDKVEGQGESRASVSGTQTNLRLQKGSLSRSGQKRQPIICCVWSDKFIHGTQTFIAADIGQVRLKIATDQKPRAEQKNERIIVSNAKHFPNI